MESTFTAIAVMIFLPTAVHCFAETTGRNSLCDISYPSDSRVVWECYELTWQDSPQGMFGDLWQDVLRFNRIDRRHLVGGLQIKVPVHLDDIRDFSPLPSAYPDAAQDEKFILVDISEMFLGTYEHGELVGSFPIAVGFGNHPAPTGEFRVDAIDRWHQSNLYKIEETDIDLPYPMHYGLRFFVDKSIAGWPSFWIHGRDLPGYPASHGCIGLYDEEMQRDYYSDHDKKAYRTYFRELTEPYLKGAREVYDWVVEGHHDSGTLHKINYGPRVLIIGSAPSMNTEDQDEQGVPSEE